MLAAYCSDHCSTIALKHHPGLIPMQHANGAPITRFGLQLAHWCADATCGHGLVQVLLFPAMKPLDRANQIPATPATAAGPGVVASPAVGAGLGP